MLRRELYNSIVSSFENKYDFLGKQFAEEFLLTAASYNLETYSNPEFRVRRHLLLYWQHSWLKSSMLGKAYHLLGDSLCTLLSDVTLAALRGTVESGQFVSPFTLKRPFSICTEFGQVVGGRDDSELIQKLLNVLEEGKVTVSLGKIAYLSEAQRHKASQDHHIRFIDDNTFTYSTNWILIASTYNRKFLIDNAFESRFNIMTPERKLDNSLTRHVVDSSRFHIDEDVEYKFREELVRDKPVDTQIKLPSAVYSNSRTVTPRDCGSMLSYILCRSWWNLKTSKDEVLQMAERIGEKRDSLWKGPDDKVFDCIEHEGKTVPQIAAELDISSRAVYYSIARLRRQGIANKVIDYEEDGKPKPVWRVA